MKNPRFCVRILFICLFFLILLAGNKEIRSQQQKLSNMERTLQQKNNEVTSMQEKQKELLSEVSKLSAIAVTEEENPEETEKTTKQEHPSLEMYYVKAVNDKVVVYQADQKTIFQPTEIRVANLPQYLQNEIKRGKYMKSTQELYNFLENYSS